jgi:peroxiredoxin Q/BCP
MSLARPLLLLFGLALALGCGPRERPARNPTRLEAVSLAPDFAVPDETGKIRTLSEFRGRPLVLYFYPKDGTPGCTREACAFRDEWQRLQATGAQVVGISLDSVESRELQAEPRAPVPALERHRRASARCLRVNRNAKGSPRAPPSSSMQRA